MNKFLASIIALSSIGFWSCDKIDDPIPEVTSVEASCGFEYPEPVQSASKRVLVEEYTGHQCGNCPAGAVEAKRIEDKYPGEVFVVSVHAGFFARTRPEGKFSTDFECEAGVTWDEDFGISAAGNPNGMVNRIDNVGNKIFGFPDWETAATGELSQNAPAEIWVDGVFSGDSICGQAFIQPFSKLDSNQALNLILIEDSIVDWQKNYKETGGNPDLPDGDIEDYVHNHVLRKSLNGPYGTLLTEMAAIPSDSVYAIGFKTDLNPNWRKSKMSLIGFVYDVNTKEILQVNKKKLN